MKCKVLSIAFLSIIILLSSCIKEEGPEREVDIISVSISDDRYVTSVVDETTREVSIIITGDISDYEKAIITPEITVSKGATIKPESGESVTLQNYRKKYVVTSEDGTVKEYTLKVVPYQSLVQDFEGWNWAKENTKKPYETPADPLWDCGNSGIHILYPDDTPYPTRSDKDVRPGSKGTRSVLLVTTEGNRNDKLDLMDIPVFSGSMFRGIFKIMMSDPLSSPHFGQPHPKFLGKPVGLKAWYKYEVGSPYITWKYVNGKKVVEKLDKKDEFNLYAVLYKVSKSAEGDNFYLTGHNIKNFNQDIIVAYTPLENPDEAKYPLGQWNEYKVKFTHKEELDFDKNNYKLAVVLASSSEGADYKGAIGSKLWVDDLKVVFEHDTEANEYK